MNKEIAVVVGATGAFGEAIVCKLISEGLHILAVSRTLSSIEKLKEKFGNISFCIADISQDESIEVIANEVNGPVRMVVHGPGLNAAGSVAEIAPKAIAESVNIKVGGMLRLVRGVKDHLVKGSRLVSIAGHYGLEPTAYASSAGVANAALINLSRQLSLEYGKQGITSHVIAPGPADTERLRNVVTNSAERRGISVEEAINELKGASSLGTLITPEQVAWGVALLLAPEADAMTGSTLMLDGGRRMGLP